MNDDKKPKKKIILLILVASLAILAIIVYILLQNKFLKTNENTSNQSVSHVLTNLMDKLSMDCTVTTYDNAIHIKAGSGEHATMSVSGNMTGIYMNYIVRKDEVYRWGQSSEKGFIHAQDGSVLKLLTAYLDRDMVKTDSTVACVNSPTNNFALPENVQFEYDVPVTFHRN